MTETQQLLAEYARNSSETAFRELVTCYVDLVYSTAVRLVEGDAHRAQDVTQTVFADLARKAGKLSGEVMLGGWLHRHTCFVAANVMRGERRRQQRERTATEMNANEDHSEANLSEIRPVLDDAINQLRPEDRTAILLRFFEKHDLRSVGEALGASENAAQKRLTRALEELRGLLKRRGVALSAAALGTALSAEAVSAAPVGLAAGISGVVLSTAAGVGGTSATLWELMSISKIKAAAIGAMAVAGLGTTLVIQQQSEAKARGLDAVYQQQAGQLAALQAENERLAGTSATARQPGRNNREELQKLREEMAALSEKTNEVARLREQSRQVQAKMKQARTLIIDDLHGPERQRTEEGPLFNNRLDYCMRMNGMLSQYMREHNGEWPTNTSQLSAQMSAQYGAWTNFAGIRPDQFEIVYEGPTPPEDKYGHPGDIIRIREKVAWQNTDGKWVKVYGMLSGQGMTHVQTNPNFDEWESRRIVPPAISKQ